MTKCIPLRNRKISSSICLLTDGEAILSLAFIRKKFSKAFQQERKTDAYQSVTQTALFLKFLALKKIQIRFFKSVFILFLSHFSEIVTK